MPFALWTGSKEHGPKDMNSLWSSWVEVFNALVDKLIGTRFARQTSWGRKFNLQYVLFVSEPLKAVPGTYWLEFRWN